MIPETGDKVSGGEANSTNNRVEIIAGIEAIKFCTEKFPGRTIFIYSDSQYLVKGAMQWIGKWKRNGWSRGSGEVKNLDLWKELELLVSAKNTIFRWVRGHNGNHWNEVADKLAYHGACNQARKHVKGHKTITLVIVDEIEKDLDDGLPCCDAEDSFFVETSCRLLF